MVTFRFQGWLNLRLRLTGVLPDFQIDLRLAARADFPAGLEFLFLDSPFDFLGYFRMASAESVDEFLRHAVDLVDHGLGVMILFEGPRPAEPFGE